MCKCVAGFRCSVTGVQPIVTQDHNATKLSYVQVEINGKMTLAMVDSSATHYFMRDNVARNLGLHYEKAQTSFKEVNSGEQEIGGTMKDIFMKLGD
jgi:hypothetical protein